MKALIFGTILFDVYPDEVLIGGCSTNVASHCALLGAETTHLSRIGRDDLGQLALKHFAAVGVDTSFVTVDDEHATGRVDVSVNEFGQPEYVLATETAYDYIHLDADRIAAIVAAGYDFIYFGTVDQRGAVSAATLRRLLDTGRFRHVFCDINLRENCYTRESVEYSLRQATILKLNEDELRDVPAILGLPAADDEAARVGALQSAFDIDLVILFNVSECS
ncbi:MAG: PfkB family carbohydrate kinase [Planctomycetes bacterium]|nr:PfkB family carbohydrate kinase [Planctomycetota bacterium]